MLPRFLAFLTAPPKDPTVVVMSTDTIETRWQHQGQAGGKWVLDLSGDDAEAFARKMVGDNKFEILIDGTVRIPCSDRQQAGVLQDRASRAAVDRGLDLKAVCEPGLLSRAITRDATRGEDGIGPTRHPLPGAALRLREHEKAAVFAIEEGGRAGILILACDAGIEDGEILLAQITAE